MSNTIKTPIVDTLGGLLADKANIGEEVDAAKAYLIGVAAQDGTKAFEGEMFRATVTFGTKRVVDYKAVLKELVDDYGVKREDLEEILLRRTEVAEGVPSVRCTARKAA
jgi:hypothetical protein